jgi:hypothetical protein
MILCINLYNKEYLNHEMVSKKYTNKIYLYEEN